MDKRFCRMILYGFALLVFCGVFLHGVGLDKKREAFTGERDSVNTEFSESLEEQEMSMSEEPGAKAVRSEGYEEIALRVDTPGGAQEILLFRQQEQACFFLPSFTADGTYTWKFDEREYAVSLDGAQVHSGDRLLPVPGQIGTMTYSRKGQEEHTCGFVLMQSEHLPTVFIETDSGSIACLNEDKTHEEAGSFLCVLANGTVDSAGKLGKISGRGHSSFYSPKKSYALRFALAADVLGMGRAKKWVLQANAYDLSRMRNRVVYELAREMGVPYAVDCAYVDVYLNGEYNGNYLLCEHVEVGLDRIDIKDGCLMERVFSSRAEAGRGQSAFIASEAGWYEMKYPQNISDRKREEMLELMDEVARLVEQSDSLEAYERLKGLVDIESFIQMFLLDEISNEPDLNRASTFYFTADDGRLYAGPVWDYDRSLGNAMSAKYEWLDCFTTGFGETLFKSPYFRQDVADSYHAHYRELLIRYKDSYIEEQKAKIDASVAMDCVRWENEELKNDPFLNYAYDTYDEDAAYLKEYFGMRYRLVDDILNHPETYHQVEFVDTGEEEYVSQKLWVRHGEGISEDVMNYLAGRFDGDVWLYEDGREYQPAPVMADMRLFSGSLIKIVENPTSME